MRRFILISFGYALLFCFYAPRLSAAASIADLSAQARQAQGQVSGKVRGDVGAQQQVIQVVGPLVLDLLSAPDLARAVADPARKPLVRNIYDSLSGPLEEVYDRNFSYISRATKAVMDQDGDLDALYETKEWKEAQLVGSQSLYFLNWLHYVGASLFDGEKKKKLLEEATNGFSEFVAGDKSSLRRESLLGRALCERELKKYDAAMRDFELLLKDDGLPADMQRKARLGLIEAAAQAGEADKAISAADQFIAVMGGSVSPDQLARVRAVRAYAMQARQQGGSKQKLAEAMAKPAEQTTTTTEAAPPEEPQFTQMEQVKGYLQKKEPAQAVPLLKEVVASTDPLATPHKSKARYLLGVILFQEKNYRESADYLDAFISNDGASPKDKSEATYLRFKAAEGLYTRAQNEETAKLYLDAANDFIRREPNHKSVYEAYYRLGEYHQHLAKSQENEKEYLAAIESYQKVNGDPEFRSRADFAVLQSYFSLLEAVEAKKSVGIDEKTLRQRIASSLQTFWKNSDALEKGNPAYAKNRTFRENRGTAAFMQTVVLSKDTEANAAQIVTVLQNFEQKYPEKEKVFPTIARMRLVALQKTGRFPELEGAVDKVFADYNKPEQQQEILTGLDQVLQRDIKKLDPKKDQDRLLAAKRIQARLRADQLERKVFPEDESPEQFKYKLAQLYLDVKEYDKAVPLYQDLRPTAYSLAAIAGLAQIAAIKGDQKQALALWEEMLKETQAGDPLWFRGSYEVAYLNAKLGNTDLACRTVNSTKPMLIRLGDQGLKKKIQALTQQCGN